MRSVSDGFLAASGRYFARLVLADGTEVESGDIVSLTLTAACNGATDRLTLGASPAASLTGTLAGSRSDLEGQQISLWLGRTVSGALEEYQMGVFTVTQATVSDGDTTTILAYDANNVEMERTTYVPGSATTARAVLAEICAQTGLALGDTGTLADADVTGYSLEGFTCRAMAGYMAALLGGNAVIDAQGRLCVRWFGDADVSLGPDEYYSGGLSLAARDWSLDTLTCSVTTTATETATDEDGNTTTAETSSTETLAWGLGSTGVELSNPWMTQAQLALIGEDIGGMSYRSGTVSCLGDLRIEAGDTVTVTDGSGNSCSVPVMELTLTYDGGLKETIAAYAQTESDGGGSGSSGPLAETVNSLKVTVANIQNLTAENLTATNAKISSLSANYASLETVVAGKADIDDLTAATARITTLETDYLTASDIEAKYASITLANVDVANVGTLFANVGLLTEMSVVNGYVTGVLNGVTINADVITAGTLSVDRLLLTGEDGIIYAINATSSGLSETELSAEQYQNYINGSCIVANSVTASQINVTDLFAQDITATGTITGMTIIGSTITGGVITGGSISGGTITGTTISGGSISIGENFSVDADGNMTTTNGSFSGEMITTSGIIGGFTIGDTGIYNGPASLEDTTAGVYLGTDGISILSSATQYTRIASGYLYGSVYDDMDDKTWYWALGDPADAASGLIFNSDDDVSGAAHYGPTSFSLPDVIYASDGEGISVYSSLKAYGILNVSGVATFTNRIVAANTYGIWHVNTSGTAYRFERLDDSDNFLLGNTNYPTHLYGSGGIYAKNTLYVGNTIRVPEIQRGAVSITPSGANTPTGVVVTFSNQFSGTPYVVATPSTTVPGTTVTGIGVSDASSTSVTIYITRTNTGSTGTRWVAVY